MGLESAPVLMALVAFGFIVVGATLQRVSGMGVGMIAAPTLSLLLGPVAGVTMANVAAIVSALILFLLLRRDVDWPRFVRLLPLLLVGCVVGAWAVRVLDRSWLEILLGGSILLAISLALGLQRYIQVRGTAAILGSGAVAGFMNTTAGVAGPAIAVYALASRWEQRAFAATLQPIFLVANTSSVVVKSLFGSAVPADVAVPWPLWVAVLTAGPVGIVIGTRVARRVRAQRARTVAICVAGVGGTVALVRGVAGVIGG